MKQNKLAEAQSEIDRLRTVNAELRGTLRVFAVEQHVRAIEGGKFVPNGKSCRICKSEWPNGWPESHAASCLLATKS